MKQINTTNRTWLIILGMHRSGTSALTGTLAACGMELGNNLLPANEFNKKGYHENAALIALNEEILQELGAEWFDPFSIRDAIRSGWTPSSHLQERMLNFLSSDEFGNSQICGLKDPRMTILLPFWKKIFNKTPDKFAYIIISRNPDEVAQSLTKRDELGQIHGEMLWCEYNLAAEYYSRKECRYFVQYEELIKNPSSVLGMINQKFKLNLTGDHQGFVESKLRNYHHKEAIRSSLLEKIFNSLNNFNATNPEHWDKLNQEYRNNLQLQYSYLKSTIVFMQKNKNQYLELLQQRHLINQKIEQINQKDFQIATLFKLLHEANSKLESLKFKNILIRILKYFQKRFEKKVSAITN
jgi:hypothetical protein